MPLSGLPTATEKLVNDERYAQPSWRKFFSGLATLFAGTPAKCTVTWGTGSPEGVIVAPVGSLFLRTNGGAATVLYVKEANSTSAGWVAK